MLNVTGKVVDASQQEDWQSLWTILAPPKAKHLLWRVCKGCLPSHAICTGEDKMKADLFATVVWILWNNRNNRVWNNVAELGRSLSFKAKQCWDEWFMVKNLQQAHLPIAQQHLITW
jgi:hypothetical protein